MQLDVDTEVVRGIAHAVREAASDASALTMPAPPACEDRAAEDAVAALLDACDERLDALAAALRSGAVLLETAHQDYARTEARTVASVPTR